MSGLKLSVALCTYNGAAFIREQLDSILSQNLQVDEIIVCDDGSTDDTVAILRQYQARNAVPSITVIENVAQLGVVRNFEKAISLCSGDIIFLSDQDDVWVPDKVAIITDYLLAHPDKEMVFTNADLIDASGKQYTRHTLFDVFGLKGTVLKLWLAGFGFEIINRTWLITGATVAFRPSLRDRALPFDTDLNSGLHDAQLSEYAINNDSLGIICENLIKYRIHAGNVCGIPVNVQKRYSELRENLFIAVTIKDVMWKYPVSDEIEARRSFLHKRHDLFQTMKGRVALLLSLKEYIKYYKSYALHFYLTDLFVGIPSYLKRHLGKLV